MKIALFLEGYNFNRKSESIALDMIFVSTGYRIPLPKIKFNKPTVMDIRPEIDDDPNTYISARVDRDFDSRLADMAGFLYRRLPLDLLTEISPTVKVVAPQLPFKTSEVLDQINAILNSQLTLNDVLELSYSGEEDEMVLVANPDSLSWVGTKTLRLDNGTLPPLVAQRELSGFKVYGSNS